MKPAVYAVFATMVLLAGCQNGEKTANDDIKKDLDQLVQASKELNAQAKEIANGSKTSADALKTLTGRLDEMHKDLAGLLAQQKRGALHLQLDAETVCDNDEQCANTARALCRKINYPNAIAFKFTPGLRPVLNSLVCFD